MIKRTSWGPGYPLHTARGWTLATNYILEKVVRKEYGSSRDAGILMQSMHYVQEIDACSLQASRLKKSSNVSFILIEFLRAKCLKKNDKHGQPSHVYLGFAYCVN